MGFRSGSYAKVWEVKPLESGKTTLVQLSISKKDKESGEYKQEFSGNTFFVGEANKKARKTLVKKARIKLEDCDVRSTYDKTKKEVQFSFIVWQYSDPNEAASPATEDPFAAPSEASDNPYPF